MDYSYTLYSYDEIKADLVRIKLEPQNQHLNYLAGQYLELAYPDQSFRPFSIANAPQTPAIIELHIRHNPQDLATYNMLCRLKTEKKIILRGPFGQAFYRQANPLPLLIIAGGTGFAYSKAIIEQIINNKEQRAIHLYWGAKTPQDFYLAELLTSWSAQLPNFKYTLTISRHEEHQAWQGATGYVQDKIIHDYPQLNNYIVYASGPPDMVKGVYLALLEHGLPKQNVYSDVIALS